ncbi:MAG: hypothetical protein A4E56_00403 [Pelotomaculum sp. PtaU1.Bin065]|nr:MAG: hypothetical protein A4E56_00403 [Pelotomaculum sp. PtaU1.Bin065]
MLEKVIMLPFSMFLIFLFAFIAVIGVTMFGQLCSIQNEAQFLAMSMGKWGGYTEQAEESLADFAEQINRDVSSMSVQISEDGPVAWGKPVTAKLIVPFEFHLGSYNVGTYQLTGTGKSVSSYLGGYDVDYVSP